MSVFKKKIEKNGCKLKKEGCLNSGVKPLQVH